MHRTHLGPLTGSQPRSHPHIVSVSDQKSTRVTLSQDVPIVFRISAVETIPGGAASFLGHAMAVPMVGLTGMMIAGEHVWPMILLVAVFALPLLIAYEYYALSVAYGGGLTPGKRFRVATFISVLAIIAFDLGMGATMLILAFALDYSHSTIAFWLVIWGGIGLGFLTAYPMVRRLLARGTPLSVLEPAEARQRPLIRDKN